MTTKPKKGVQKKCRENNTIHSESQIRNQISVGIDMGGSLWATAIQNLGNREN